MNRPYIQVELLLDDQIVIGDDEDLLLSETLDSLSVTRLVQHLEATLGLTIPPEDVTLEHFQTLRAIDAYLKARL